MAKLKKGGTVSKLKKKPKVTGTPDVVKFKSTNQYILLKSFEDSFKSTPLVQQGDMSDDDVDRLAKYLNSLGLLAQSMEIGGSKDYRFENHHKYLSPEPNYFPFGYPVQTVVAAQKLIQCNSTGVSQERDGNGKSGCSRSIIDGSVSYRDNSIAIICDKTNIIRGNNSNVNAIEGQPRKLDDSSFYPSYIKESAAEFLYRLDSDKEKLNKFVEVNINNDFSTIGLKMFKDGLKEQILALDDDWVNYEKLYGKFVYRLMDIKFGRIHSILTVEKNLTNAEAAMVSRMAQACLCS